MKTETKTAEEILKEFINQDFDRNDHLNDVPLDVIIEAMEKYAEQFKSNL